MTPYEGLERDYRAAFLRHLARREESSLHTGYELGRAALAAHSSLLDVVRVHHELLVELLRDSPAEEAPLIAGAAAEFLLEVLASYDMAQRGIPG